MRLDSSDRRSSGSVGPFECCELDGFEKPSVSSPPGRDVICHIGVSSRVRARVRPSNKPNLSAHQKLLPLDGRRGTAEWPPIEEYALTTIGRDPSDLPFDIIRSDRRFLGFTSNAHSHLHDLRHLCALGDSVRAHTEHQLCWWPRSNG